MTSHEHLKNLIRELDIDPSPIIELFGKEKVMQALREELIKEIGLSKVIGIFGRDKVIETIGRENVLATIFPNLTKEQIKKLIEQNGNK